MTAPELMTALGYACLGRDPAMQDCQLWLKQCGPRGLLVTLVASAACLLIGSLGEIFGLLTVLINVFSSLSVAAVIVLRRTMPDAPRPFRVPLYPITPLVYLALAGWSIVASVMEGGWYAILSSIAVVVVLLLIRPILSFRSVLSP